MEHQKKESGHGGYRPGAGRKRKQEGVSKVIRIPAIDAKHVEVFVDIKHATFLERPYTRSNKDVVEMIQLMELFISEFKKRVNDGNIESREDIPSYYFMK